MVHEDDDIVVVDKPVGVAAHPSPGWTGPTVVGGLAAAGYRISTPGAAERQGVVHRLDVGTTGVMVVAKSERAYTVLKRAFKERTVERATTRSSRATRTRRAAPSTRRSTGTQARLPVGGRRRRQAEHHPLRARSRRSARRRLLDIRLETGRTHQIRVHIAALRHPCVGDLTYGADPTLAARLGLTRQWLHARRLAFEHPADGRGWSSPASTRDDLRAALDRLRGGKLTHVGRSVFA